MSPSFADQRDELGFLRRFVTRGDDVFAGVTKRQHPGAPEEELVLAAIWDLVGPRLVFQDVPLFKGLLADLFPGVSNPLQPTTSLREAIEDELRAQHVEVWGPGASTRFCTSMPVFMYIYVYACGQVYIHVCMCIYMYACAYTSMHV